MNKPAKNFSYGELKTAVMVIAKSRHISLTDGPSLLAIAQEIMPTAEAWEHGAVARLALDTDNEFTLVPGP